MYCGIDDYLDGLTQLGSFEDELLESSPMDETLRFIQGLGVEGADDQFPGIDDGLVVRLVPGQHVVLDPEHSFLYKMARSTVPGIDVDHLLGPHPVDHKLVDDVVLVDALHRQPSSNHRYPRGHGYLVVLKLLYCPFPLLTHLVRMSEISSDLRVPSKVVQHTPNIGVTIKCLKMAPKGVMLCVEIQNKQTARLDPAQESLHRLFRPVVKGECPRLHHPRNPVIIAWGTVYHRHLLSPDIQEECTDQARFFR